MKKITYVCDYCGEEIDNRIDAVCALRAGHIAGNDMLINDDDETPIQHYHDYCMNYLLILTAEKDKNRKHEDEVEDEPEEDEALETEPEPAPDPVPDVPTIDVPKAKVPKPEHASRKRDLPALQAFLDTGRTQAWCADEFKVATSTISYWKKEIEAMKKEGTWEEYCEERRKR